MMGVMPYMVSVNKIIRILVMPVIIIMYLLFLLYDYNYYDGNGRVTTLEEHIYNISNQNIDSLILGGSNSYLSLSAEILSSATSDNWYNLSLFSEGYTDENYMLFLQELFSNSKGQNIQTIIYSSIYPNREERFIKERKYRRMDITGRQRSIKPNTSFISYLKNSQEKYSTYPLPNQYGDFNFENFECNLKGRSDFRPARVSVSVPWLFRNIANIQSIFPNANIYIVSPPEYLENIVDPIDVKKHIQNLYRGIKNLSEEGDEIINFSLIAEESFNSKSLLCDDYHHANLLGRIYRTKNLLAQMQSISKR
jgi:hypothetical protein